MYVESSSRPPGNLEKYLSKILCTHSSQPGVPFRDVTPPVWQKTDMTYSRKRPAGQVLSNLMNEKRFMVKLMSDVRDGDLSTNATSLAYLIRRISRHTRREVKRRERETEKGRERERCKLRERERERLVPDALFGTCLLCVVQPGAHWCLLPTLSSPPLSSTPGLRCQPAEDYAFRRQGCAGKAAGERGCTKQACCHPRRSGGGSRTAPRTSRASAAFGGAIVVGWSAKPVP